MVEKTRIKKGNADPLHQKLAELIGRFAKWNFHKYLIARDGRLVGRYSSFTKPQSRSLTDSIEILLAEAG